MEQDRKERSDLLTSKNKYFVFLKRKSNTQPSTDPPDGGIRALMVMVGSFVTNGLIFGIVNSYSVIYMVLIDRLKKQNTANPEVEASLAGALTMGMTFLMSPLSGTLTGFMGLRATSILGGSIATIGMLLSSFVANSANSLCFTYGVLYGLGASLVYTPSLAVLGHYFKRYLGIVNGVVTIGSSIFTVMMPPLMEFMIRNYGLEWMFRLLAVFTFGLVLCGMLFKPIAVTESPLKGDKSLKSVFKAIVNVELWKNKKYRLWAICMPVALFGYFVPYIHIRKFLEDLQFDKTNNNNLPLQCIAIMSGIGRLLFGFLADKPRIDKILLQQISFYVIGVLTIILPFVHSFGLIVAIALGMGLFEGGFIALVGPVGFELCGAAFAAQGIGCMLGIAATPLSIGPPIAGALYRIHNSYTLPFVLAGLSPLIGSTLMFTIRCYGNDKQEVQTNGNIILSQADVEKTNTESLLAANGNVSQSQES